MVRKPHPKRSMKEKLGIGQLHSASLSQCGCCQWCAVKAGVEFGVWDLGWAVQGKGREMGQEQDQGQGLGPVEYNTLSYATACPAHVGRTGSEVQWLPKHSSAWSLHVQKCTGALCSLDMCIPPTFKRTTVNYKSSLIIYKDLNTLQVHLSYCSKPFSFSVLPFRPLEQIHYSLWLRRYILRSRNSLSTSHTVLEAMNPKAGYVIINNLHLSSFKSCILKQVQLVISTFLKRERTRLLMLHSKSAKEPHLNATYHFKRLEGAQDVATLATGPGAPPRILSFLEDKLLPTKTQAFKPYPSNNKDIPHYIKLPNCNMSKLKTTEWYLKADESHSRSWLHNDRANSWGLF